MPVSVELTFILSDVHIMFWHWTSLFLGYAHNEHVLAMENEGAEYLLDPSSKRYSVKVPLHLQSGCEYSLISLKFMCKTSCTGGLNRAPTDIIFTLEDAQWVFFTCGKNSYTLPNHSLRRDLSALRFCIFVYRGAVLGRQVIGVKICSCPKRDKEKDEQNFGEPSTGKRKIKVKREEKTTVEEPPLKKVKQEVPTEPGSCSFMVRNEIQLAICLLCYEALNWAQFCVFQVHAINPEVASTLKAHLHQWNGIKMWEYAEPGVIPTPVIEVVDTIAVLPHPYNWLLLWKSAICIMYLKSLQVYLCSMLHWVWEYTHTQWYV